MLNPCWLPHYRLALHYAFLFNKEFKFDITHNMWIAHQRTHQEDIFNVDYPSYAAFLYQAIKWSAQAWLTSERLKSGRYQSGIDGDEILSIFHSPLDTLVAQDLYNQLYDKLYLATTPTKKKATRNRELALSILKLITQGYTQQDIEKEIGVSKQQVFFYVNKIRELMYINPFSGSKTPIKKKISQQAWARRKDHEDFEYEDEKEDVKLYVHKESGEGWLVALDEVKSSEFYIQRLVDSGKG